MRELEIAESYHLVGANRPGEEHKSEGESKDQAANHGHDSWGWTEKMELNRRRWNGMVTPAPVIGNAAGKTLSQREVHQSQSPSMRSSGMQVFFGFACTFVFWAATQARISRVVGG